MDDLFPDDGFIATDSLNDEAFAYCSAVQTKALLTMLRHGWNVTKVQGYLHTDGRTVMLRCRDTIGALQPDGSLERNTIGRKTLVASVPI